MDRWLGKIALVTGASSGIGKSIASKLTESGMKVIGCARSLESLKSFASDVNVVGKGEFIPYKCDLKEEKEILGMFGFIKEKFGTIHVCVNNAGLAFNAPVLSGKTEDWKGIFDVNVFALTIGTREAISLMRASGVDDGHVININSVSGHAVAVRNVMYCASKFAVTAITDGLRQELREAKSHIRVTSVSPGYVETDFAYRMHAADPEKAKQTYSRIKCLEPNDVANSVLFAMSSPPHMDVNEIIVRPTED